MAAIEFTRYLFDAQTYRDQEDIPYTVVDLTDPFRGGSYVVFGLSELEAWAIDNICSCPGPTSGPSFIPQNVYPVANPTAPIYEREHFSEALKMFRGDTYSRSIVCIQDGSFFDITNYDIRMTFKWSVTDDDIDAVIVLTSEPGEGITKTNPTNGEFQFTLLPADTSGLPSFPVELEYDAQITSNVQADLVYTVLVGKILVVPDTSITVP